jgi:hypothetical protein
MSNKQPHRNILLPTIFVLLIAAVLSTGCVDISSYMEIKSDGTISEYSVVAKTSVPKISNFVREEVGWYASEEEIYESVSEFVSELESELESELLSEFGSRGYADYFVVDVVNNRNDVIVTLKNKKPLTISDLNYLDYLGFLELDDFGSNSYWSNSMSVTSHDGTVTFRQSMGDIEESAEGIRMLTGLGGSAMFTLKMPGKVVSSNADEVKGDTAVWYFRYPVREIWATSKTAGFPFGWLAIVLVICAAVGVFLWRRL